MKHLARCILLLTILPAVQAANSSFPDTYANQRQLFISAEQALEQGERLKFWDALKSLRDYPLYPYLRYADLKSRIDSARSSEVLSFIKAFEDSPVSGRLHLLWLKTLADKRQWQDFLKYYTPTANKSLLCLREMARSANDSYYRGEASIEPIWMTAYSLPQECDSLIEGWERKGLISEGMYRNRIKLALRKHNPGLARYLIKQLPDDTRQAMQTWLRVYEDSRLLQQHDVLQHPEIAELVRFKFSALAWYYPDQAISFAERLSDYKQLAPVSAYVHQILAISLARKFHPQARQWLYRVPEEYVSSRVVKWRIRTALQQQDWQQVLSNIKKLKPGMQNEDRWQYWQARALSQLGQQAQAQAIYNRISANRSYEGFLAADILGKDYAFRHEQLDIDQVDVRSLSQHPGMIRARELMLLKRFALARSEWNVATDNMSVQQLSTAAWLAYQWGWSNQTIVTLAELSKWDDLELRFPVKHMSEINEHTRSTIIDPALALAVIRQESAFQENARSPSNARGLMQLMPSTAREVARQLNVKQFDLNLLNEPDINIRLGVSYLNEIKHELMMHPVLAIAAYNAGKNRVLEWLEKTNSLPVDIWIENVPFRETRNYLRNILAYAVVYEKRLGLPIRRIRDRMPPIPKTVEGSTVRT